MITLTGILLERIDNRAYVTEGLLNRNLHSMSLGNEGYFCA
jgi:hypothetical protein